MRHLEQSIRKRLIETAELFHADAKLGQCIVRSEFSEYFVTALVKRLEAAALQRKRLQLPADARANHDDASEDEHGGGGDGEAHCVACACMESLCQKAPALSQPSRANASITSSGIVARTGHETWLPLLPASMSMAAPRA